MKKECARTKMKKNKCAHSFFINLSSDYTAACICLYCFNVCLNPRQKDDINHFVTTYRRNLSESRIQH